LKPILPDIQLSRREKKGGDGALACRSFVDIYEECARKIVQAIDVTKAPQ
jgi:hypothetical protein